MSAQSITKNPVDLLRLTDEERGQLEAYLLRENHKLPPGKNVRAAPRFHYKTITPTIVELPCNTGEPQSYIVLAKDLSATGFAFIHGAFVYPSSRCVVMLCKADHGRILVAGSVLRCELLKGRAHEVAVKFDEPIDPRNFVTGAKKDEAGSGARPVISVDDARVQTVVAELGAMANHRDCPPAVRRKIQQLAELITSGPQQGAGSGSVRNGAAQPPRKQA